MKQNFQAIVLDKKDIGETDRFYTFYTKEIGLLKIPAKGIRKSQARLSAQVELFNFVNIVVAKNRGKGLLAGGIAEQYFFDLKNNYFSLTEVFRARDFFLKIIYGHEVDQKLFLLFLEYLNLINGLSSEENLEKRVTWLTNSFLFKVYFLQGYHFSFQECHVCKKVVLSGENNFFSSLASGIVCQDCARNVKFKNQIDANTIKALRLLTKNNLTNLAKVLVDDKVNNQMSVVVKDILTWILR